MSYSKIVIVTPASQALRGLSLRQQCHQISQADFSFTTKGSYDNWNDSSIFELFSDLASKSRRVVDQENDRHRERWEARYRDVLRSKYHLSGNDCVEPNKWRI